MARLSQMHKDVLLILGANSDIAKSIAIEFIKRYPNGYLLLAGRNESEIQNFIETNNFIQKAKFLKFDASNFDRHQEFANSLPLKPSVIVYSAGVLADNEVCENNPTKFIEMSNINFTGAVNILTNLLNVHNPFLKRIIGISSIAGLRGRKQNFYYGSTKSALHQFLFGLRQKLCDRDIVVQSCTPGFVETKMTNHLKLSQIANKPNEIAISIMETHSKFEIYPNFRWRIIGALVKYLPEFLIKKI
jgi:NADP-dependent 3-hydroxy acid dehydrogenase YdfG